MSSLCVLDVDLLFLLARADDPLGHSLQDSALMHHLRPLGTVDVFHLHVPLARESTLNFRMLDVKIYRWKITIFLTSFRQDIV